MSEEDIRIGGLLLSSADRAILNIINITAKSIIDVGIAYQTAKMVSDRQRIEVDFWIDMANRGRMTTA